MLQNGISEPISTAGSRPLRGRGRGRLIHPVHSSVFNKEPLAVVLKNQKDDEKIKYCSDSTNTLRAKQKKPEQQLYVPRPRRIKQQLFQDADNYQQQQQQQQQQLHYSTEEEDDIRSGQAPYQHELSSSLCNIGQSQPTRKNTTKNGCNLKKNRREVEIYVPRAKRQMQLQSGGGGGGGFDVTSKSIPPVDCREPTSPLDRISKDYDIESLSVNNNNNINRSARCQDPGCDIYFQVSRSVHGLEGFSPGIKDANSGVSCNFSNNISHKSGKAKRYEYHCNSSSADFGYSDKDSLSPLSLKSQSVAGNHDRDGSSFHRPAAGAAAVAIQRTRSPETRAIINKVSRRDGTCQETSSHSNNHSTSMSARKYSKEVSPTPNTLQNTKTDLSSTFSTESMCDSDSNIKLPNVLSVPSKDNTPLEPVTMVQGDEDHQSSAEKTVQNPQNESSAGAKREKTPPKANSLSTKLHSDSTNSENVHSSTCDQTESEESSETEPDLSQSYSENMNSSQPECNSSKASTNESSINACEQQESEISCSTNCDGTTSRAESSLDRSSPSSSKLDQCDGDTNSKSYSSSRTTTTTPSNDSICSSDSTAKTEKSSSQAATTSTSTAVVDVESWEALYDDNGDCLEPQALEELTASIGKVQIQKNKINYLDFQPKDSELDYKAYDHVLEVFDFSSELQTRDIISVFSTFKERGFDIKWVDDTHALAIFNSPVAANDALAQNHPLLKVRPMSEASKKSKQKAKRCTEFLQPYKPRPETSAITARRMVTGALGLTPHISKQKRDQERQQLKEAREKKRQDRLTKNYIWDGNIGKCAMDTSDN